MFVFFGHIRGRLEGEVMRALFMPVVEAFMNACCGLCGAGVCMITMMVCVNMCTSGSGLRLSEVCVSVVKFDHE